MADSPNTSPAIGQPGTGHQLTQKARNRAIFIRETNKNMEVCHPAYLYISSNMNEETEINKPAIMGYFRIKKSMN